MVRLFCSGWAVSGVFSFHLNADTSLSMLSGLNGFSSVGKPSKRLSFSL